MAQVLKEEQRNKILAAAKKELLEKGVRDASMRKIAFSASMTVGNLYRYFKNKEELIQVIVSPTIQRLNQVIEEKTEDRISLYRQAESLGLKTEDILVILDSLVDELMSIDQEYHDEMMILMLHSEVSQQIENWFAQLIQVLACECFIIPEEKLNQVPILSTMMAASICSGFQKFFTMADSAEGQSVDMQECCKIYFHLFVKLLNVNEKRMGETS